MSAMIYGRIREDMRDPELMILIYLDNKGGRTHRQRTLEDLTSGIPQEEGSSLWRTESPIEHRFQFWIGRLRDMGLVCEERCSAGFHRNYEVTERGKYLLRMHPRVRDLRPEEAGYAIKGSTPA